MKKGILFLLGMFSIFLFIPCAWTMNKPIDMTEEELQIDMTEEELQNAIKEKKESINTMKTFLEKNQDNQEPSIKEVVDKYQTNISSDTQDLETLNRELNKRRRLEQKSKYEVAQIYISPGVKRGREGFEQQTSDSEIVEKTLKIISDFINNRSKRGEEHKNYMDMMREHEDLKKDFLFCQQALINEETKFFVNCMSMLESVKQPLSDAFDALGRYLSTIRRMSELKRTPEKTGEVEVEEKSKEKTLEELEISGRIEKVTGKYKINIVDLIKIMNKAIEDMNKFIQGSTSYQDISALFVERSSSARLIAQFINTAIDPNATRKISGEYGDDYLLIDMTPEEKNAMRYLFPDRNYGEKEPTETRRGAGKVMYPHY